MARTRDDRKVSRVLPSSGQGDGDPRRTRVPISEYHEVSVEGAGLRAKHQRRPPEVVPSKSSEIRDWILILLIPILVVAFLRLFVAQNYIIPSRSMADTLQVNDRIITSKLAPSLFELKRGDVIVFKDPANWLGQETGGVFGSEYLVKRLIGLPGDRVQCCNASGQVTINGTAIDETGYIRPGVDPSSIPFDITVSEGHLFVMGDNRANSADSRYHYDDGANGLVPVEDVAGVAKIVYWPIGRIQLIGRHDDVFANVPGISGVK